MLALAELKLCKYLSAIILSCFFSCLQTIKFVALLNYTQQTTLDDLQIEKGGVHTACPLQVGFPFESHVY